MQIDHRPINQEQAPYVIAELSANHNGNLDRALAIMTAAKAAGASAVKLQTYRPGTITLKSDRPEFQIHGGLWDGHCLYDLYEWAHTPWEWHQALFAKGRELELTVFSSPFDFSAVDLLESLDCPAYKIASFELVDLPLIRYAAQTGKPLIMSTGMANEAEIAAAVEMALKHGNGQLALLHCVSGYPAPAAEYNLRTIPMLRQRFGIEVGLSDHTLGSATAIAATALGATLLEKHFTLARADGGPDCAFSMEPAELTELVASVNTAHAALGVADYQLTASEQGNRAFRRSLYLVKEMVAGEVLTAEHIKSVRPALGLPPADYDRLIGKRVNRSLSANQPLSWEWIDNDE
ncbi:TPA: pseudaminic acid synthase [Aeromonas veronii]|uniref:pseudaminic acid synthase n=1 Tax=Aeromonas veronii TaxID=654 RepID=UPI003312B30F|nr:pseudaminic acid synthase [Aeromonas veronii]HDO1335879.1 pseudaminic acid synthase [Aeromonas veronii]HDO1337004.1 pseudaminic acid synthase [Aeromonas veronii]HDO1342230.1 pseudaminic acid synthase [Aeromonas veronii]HDO1346569.1 pseudaminic acid synthase [Aeromonas veronii]